jgi:hypothetical protein
MALVYATKNGNWSDTTVWNTGILPDVVDIVRPNNFTVTIDISLTVLEMRNDAGGGAVLGGSFTLNDGVTVTTSNGFFGTYGSSGIGLLNYGGAGSVIINGNVEGSKSAVSNTCAISNNSTGTITINGNISSSGSGSTAQTLRNQSNGTLIINGNLTSVSGELIRNVAGTTTINGNIASNSGTAISNTSGTVTITGNLTTNSGTAITNTSGTITITGNSTCNASAAGRCIVNTSGTVTVVGDLFIQVSGAGQSHRNITNATGTINVIGIVNGAGGSSNGIQYCITNDSSTGVINITGTVNGITTVTSTIPQGTILNSVGGTVNITGLVNASTVAGTIGQSTIFNAGGGVVNINGNCQGSTGIAIFNSVGTTTINGNVIGGVTVAPVINNSTGTINLNGNAIGGTSFAIDGVNAAGNTIIERAVYSNLGQSPITGYIKFKTTNPEIDVLRTDNVIVTLRDPLNVSGLLPATSDVRSGTTYNTGSSTGTLAMPAANLVQLGVPVGATFGTANLTPGDFWNYLISGITQSGSIGERLKVSSTLDTTLAQIASFS